MLMEGREMDSAELVVGRIDGYSTIPLTLAWVNILKRSKGVDNLKRVCLSHGINWDKVIYAQIEVWDPDTGFCIHDLLDCAG